MPAEIKVTCDVQNRVAFKDLVPIQGDLKSLSKSSYEKLKKSITKHGIHSPVFVWKNEGKLNILDGHQRTRAYSQLEKEGYKIPLIPIVEIDAPDIKTAKQILLTLVSQYGKLEDQGLYEFILDADISLEDLADYDLPGLNLEKFNIEFGEGTFDPGSEEDQGQLDEKSPIECPHCGVSFVPKR